jgi:shikimate kinase
VSCGGGLPAHGDNSAVLRDLFAGFWLHVSLETAMARAGDDPARPLLHGAPRERLAGLLESRTDAYVASSRVIVDAEEGSADTVAEGIFDEVRRALAG